MKLLLVNVKLVAILLFFYFSELSWTLFIEYILSYVFAAKNRSVEFDTNGLLLADEPDVPDVPVLPELPLVPDGENIPINISWLFEKFVVPTPADETKDTGTCQ